jgi:hypothetical protein
VAKYCIGTIVLYGLALVIGTPGLIGQWRFPLPAAVLVAIPMVIGAARERHA